MKRFLVSLLIILLTVTGLNIIDLSYNEAFYVMGTAAALGFLGMVVNTFWVNDRLESGILYVLMVGVSTMGYMAYLRDFVGLS